MTEQVKKIQVDLDSADSIVIETLDKRIKKNPHMIKASCDYIHREFKLLPKDIQSKLLEELKK